MFSSEVLIINTISHQHLRLMTFADTGRNVHCRRSNTCKITTYKLCVYIKHSIHHPHKPKNESRCLPSMHALAIYVAGCICRFNQSRYPRTKEGCQLVHSRKALLLPATHNFVRVLAVSNERNSLGARYLRSSLILSLLSKRSPAGVAWATHIHGLYVDGSKYRKDEVSGCGYLSKRTDGISKADILQGGAEPEGFWEHTFCYEFTEKRESFTQIPCSLKKRIMGGRDM